jgi:hypothetical protein
MTKSCPVHSAVFGRSSIQLISHPTNSDTKEPPPSDPGQEPNTRDAGRQTDLGADLRYSCKPNLSQQLVSKTTLCHPLFVIRRLSLPWCAAAPTLAAVKIEVPEELFLGRKLHTVQGIWLPANVVMWSNSVAVGQAITFPVGITVGPPTAASDSSAGRRSQVRDEVFLLRGADERLAAEALDDGCWHDFLPAPFALDRGSIALVAGTAAWLPAGWQVRLFHVLTADRQSQQWPKQWRRKWR